MWMIWRHVFAVVAVVLSALPAMAQVQQYGWQTLQSTTGTGSGTELDINGYNSVSIDVEMTSTGTVTLKIKGDGSYRDLTCTSAGDTSAALVTSVTSSTQLVCSTFGLSKIQTPITANGGTITVKARVSNTMARRGSVGGGGGGSGDVTDVWGCTTGNCNALTGAAGDSFDAGSADSSKPATRSTSLPGTCTEGQLHQDTDSGGSETYVCTASNTWSKLAATSEIGAGVTDGDKGDITVSGSGATWTVDAAAKAHALLDPIHTDTVAGAPVVGDLLIADSGNLWSSLGGPTSASERCFYSTGTGTAANPPYWGPCSEVKSVTGTTYTILASDNRKLLAFSNASSTAVTLSQATTAGFGNSLYFFAKAVGAGTATITPTTSTINGAASLALAPNEGAIIWSNGTNYEALKISASSASEAVGLRTSTFVIEEEFCSGLNSNGNIGNHGLYMASGTFQNVNPTTGHPCIINIASGAVSGNLGRLFFGANDSPTAVMGDVQHMRFLIRPQSVDANTSIRCGFIVTTATTLEGSDGVYMSYLNSASDNWRAVTRVTSLTATNSSVAAGIDTWVQFDIVRNGSNWDFSLNQGAPFATPATSTGPSATTAGKVGCVIETAAAAAKSVDYDYYGWAPLNPLSARHP